MPNGPEIDEKCANKIQREEEIFGEGPTSLEEELMMRELKIGSE
jgi:hypothetical protein